MPSQLRCPDCASRWIVTKQDGIRYCRKCGHKGPAAEFEKR